MNKFSLKAVAIGGIVDVLLSLISGVMITVCVFIVVRMRHPGAGQGHALRVAGHSLFWVYFCVGCLFSVFGGYLAGRIAKREELLHGAASSWLCILYALVMQIRAYIRPMNGYQPTPIWLSSLVMIGSIVFGLAGGYLAATSRRTRA